MTAKEKGLQKIIDEVSFFLKALRATKKVINIPQTKRRKGRAVKNIDLFIKKINDYKKEIELL